MKQTSGIPEYSKASKLFKFWSCDISYLYQNKVSRDTTQAFRVPKETRITKTLHPGFEMKEGIKNET